MATPPTATSGPVGVNIFTPVYDPNAPASPYSSPAPAVMNPSSSYTPPTPAGNMHSNSNSSLVQLDMPTTQQSGNGEGGFQLQSPQDLTKLLEWLKTNETVNKMMKKAKVRLLTCFLFLLERVRAKIP